MMENEELKATRNFVRWLIRELDDSIFNRSRDNNRFWVRLVTEGTKLKVFKEDGSMFRLTKKEQLYDLHDRKPRHGRRYSYRNKK